MHLKMHKLLSLFATYADEGINAVPVQATTVQVAAIQDPSCKALMIHPLCDD